MAGNVEGGLVGDGDDNEVGDSKESKCLSLVSGPAQHLSLATPARFGAEGRTGQKSKGASGR